MRKLAAMLALTTVVFAATTAYYRHLWSVERSHRAAVESANAALAARVEPAPHFVAPESSARDSGAAAPVSPEADLRQAATTTSAPHLPSEEESRRREIGFSRAYLEQLAVPQARGDLVGQMKVSMRQMYPKVDKVLGLTPDEYDRLLEIQAQEQVRLQEIRARCVVDPACDPNQLTYDSQQMAREISTLLGPQREGRWEAYKGSLGEREVVTHLRQRLPDTFRLDDDNAERLITALADERMRIQQEASQANGGINSYGFGAGMVFTTGNGSFESRLESAQRYSQRLRERAALFLDAGQMRAFDELQDEQLLQLRAAMRQKEMFDATASRE